MTTIRSTLEDIEPQGHFYSPEPQPPLQNWQTHTSESHQIGFFQGTSSSTHDLTQLLGLLRQSQVMVALFDQYDQLRYANAAFRHHFALRPDEFPSWTELMRLSHARGAGVHVSAKDHEAWITACFSRRGRVPHKAFASDLKGGEWFWITETVNDQGWLLSLGSDVTAFTTPDDSQALIMDRDNALRVAHTDELTNALNRRGILSALRQMLENTEMLEQTGMSIMLIDLDHFKKVNDQYGHHAGDQVLQHFVEQCYSLSRRKDLFGRYGGEEFLFLLPGAASMGAMSLFQRIQSTLVNKPVSISAALNITYNCSAGIATYIKGDTRDSLLLRADDALYRAKRRGRNCCEWG